MKILVIAGDDHIHRNHASEGFTPPAECIRYQQQNSVLNSHQPLSTSSKDIFWG
jgi:hypothetical protein